MKIILTSLLILFGLQVYSQSNLNIGLTDYNVVFMNYNNRLQCSVDGVDSVYIKSPDGGAKVSFEVDQLTGQKYFIINPTHSRTINLEVHTIKNGRDEVYATQTYYVKAYPKPELTNPALSKSNPNELEVSYPTYFPIKTEFEIIGGELAIGSNSVSFEGSTVPADLLKTVKKGEMVVLTVNYRLKTKKEGSSILMTGLTVMD